MSVWYPAHYFWLWETQCVVDIFLDFQIFLIYFLFSCLCCPCDGRLAPDTFPISLRTHFKWVCGHLRLIQASLNLNKKTRQNCCNIIVGHLHRIGVTAGIAVTRHPKNKGKVVLTHWSDWSDLSLLPVASSVWLVASLPLPYPWR